jgi:acyl-coenzyme A synthetase/AMP-(fatty) acid ligase/thioesterase domain-containing protein/acyl carrier protein
VIENPQDTDAVFTFREEELSGSILDRFAQVATRYPEHVAVKSGNRWLTYRELELASNRASSALRARLGDAPEAVAILTAPSVRTVVALLGIIKAGKYYCALNPGDPASRNQAILEDLKARLLIIDVEFRERFGKLVPEGSALATLDELDTGADEVRLPPIKIGPKTRAAVFFTSGTTGEPKGIPRDHRGMLYRAWLDSHLFAIQPGDRLVMLRGFMFSGSAGDIASALLNGAGLYIYEVRQLGIARLPEYLNQEGITIFRPPIELLRYFLDTLDADDFFPGIRCLVLSGDTLYKKDVERIRVYFSKEALIVHHLASSETGILARHVIGPETIINSEIVPVGYPAPGKEILILDNNGQKLGPNQVGEISVRSRFIDSEDATLPEFMEDQFIRDPDDPSKKVYLTSDIGRLRLDGLLEFIGRKDFQVKIRGYRVNTPAIVSKLMELEGIKHAIVTARVDPSGEKRLVAYYVAVPREGISVESLRIELAKNLPDYMIPTALVCVDLIPVTDNGKVDINALPDPDWSHPGIQSEVLPPRDDIERKLVVLWQEVLGVERVGIHDDFFALGGHSLTGASLCVRIEKEFGKKVYPALLVENNSVARLANALRHQSLPRKNIIPIQTDGSKLPLFLAPGNEGDTLYFRTLASYLGPDQPVYGLQVTDLGDVLPPMPDLETMAAYFMNEIRIIQPCGPYFLAGHSFGGRLAFALAHLLVQAGEWVDLLLLMDTFAPGHLPKGTFLERIRLHVANLSAISVREWPAYFRQRLNNVIVRLSGVRTLRPFISRFRLIPSDASSKNRIATRGYVYRRYPGKLVFFHVNERPSYVHTDLTASWQDYAALVEVHDVPGDHATLLNEPQVGVLAEKLKKCLQDAQTIHASRLG